MKIPSPPHLLLLCTLCSHHPLSQFTSPPPIPSISAGGRRGFFMSIVFWFCYQSLLQVFFSRLFPILPSRRQGTVSYLYTFSNATIFMSPPLDLLLATFVFQPKTSGTVSTPFSSCNLGTSGRFGLQEIRRYGGRNWAEIYDRFNFIFQNKSRMVIFEGFQEET
ncbi:unnamed protein product [Lactuca virosa]|uniref:Uncharacterized protein n=1 Tax=Lactuca virosa TaxID=75947 RepID=A0AAU9MJV6_9ASTR|nr:unnamed protein product [Lactuca virosa]